MNNYGITILYKLHQCRHCTLRDIIAPLSDIEMFYIKRLSMYKVHMHAAALRKLLYGLYVCTGDNPLAKARGLSSRTYAQTIQ